MKVKKRLLVSVIMTSLVFTACSTFKNNVVDMDGLKVAYVVRSGALDDKSVGQLGYEGILKAKEQLGIKEQVLEVDVEDPKEVEKKLKSVAEKNDLIIMNGRDLSELSVEVSALFREKKIVIIGVNETETNIHDINFKDEEGGFLMGVIAGRTTKSNKIGFISYEKYEDTDRLLSGFIAGVKVVNPEATVGLLSNEYVVYTKDAEPSEKQVYDATKSLTNKGVDVIIEKIAVEETEVFKAAKESNAYVIGVGSDKYEYYPEYKEVILSSILKKVDELTYEVIEKTKNGEFKSGEKNSLLVDLKSGKLDYSKSTEKTISQELLKEVKDYKEKIIEKVIEVPKSHTEVLEFTL